nr:MAG TPA: hypothetical protein [Caudoviricetes sp.]
MNANSLNFTSSKNKVIATLFFLAFKIIEKKFNFFELF